MKQFILFSLIASIAVVINVSLRYVLSNIVHFEFYTAVTVAYLSGMLFNYFFNKKYNFRTSNRKYIKELHSFLVVSLVGLILTNLFSFVFINLFAQIGFSGNNLDSYSHISSVLLVGIYSFIAHKYLTFREGIIVGLKKYSSRSLSKIIELLK